MIMFGMQRTFNLVFVAFLLWFYLLSQLTVNADDGANVRQLVDGLRQRRLYDLADYVCLKHLDSQKSSAVLQANMGIELIKTKTSRAANSPDNVSEQLWNDAHNGGNEFFRRFPNHPRGVLVEVQQAITWLTRGKTLSFELQAGWGGQDKRAEVDRVLAKAIQELSIQQRDVEKMIPLQRRSNLTADELSAGQLQALTSNILLQIAQAHRYRAMFETEQANIVDSLNQSLKRLEDLKLQLDVNDPLYAKCELDRASCLRILGRLSESLTILDRLQQDAPDDSEILAEQLRLAVAAKNTNKIKTYLDLLSTFRMRSAELDVLLMQSTLALAAMSKDQSDKALFQGRAVKMSNSINSRHGNYWGSRARMLLINVESATAGNSADIKVAMAQRAYQQQRWSEAISAFRAAARIAENNEQTELAFKWYRSAAAIEQQTKKYLEAANSYRSLALQFPENKQSGDVHLLACWNLAQQLDAENNNLALYSSWLQEHIEKYPEQDNSNQARYWYAKVLTHQKQWQQAVDQCFDVDIANPYFASAINLAGQCAGYLLATIDSIDEREKKRGELINEFSSFMSENLAQPGVTWSESDRQAIISIASLAVEADEHLSIDVSQLLKNAINDAPPAKKAWVQSALVWRAIYLAQKPGNDSEIDATLARVEPTPEHIERLLVGLTRLDAKSSQSVAKAKTAFYRFTRSQWDSISEVRKTQWELIYAQGLFDSGEQAKSLQKYQQLAKQHPKSITIQLEYARRLTNAGSPSNNATALVQWRTIAAGTKKHTEVWFEAKYNVANLLVANGQSDRAKEMLRLIKLVAPPDTKSLWMEKIEGLLSAINN